MDLLGYFGYDFQGLQSWSFLEYFCKDQQLSYCEFLGISKQGLWG